jgi:N-acetylmuramoyl-L-alanine amidase
MPWTDGRCPRFRRRLSPRAVLAFGLAPLLSGTLAIKAFVADAQTTSKDAAQTTIPATPAPPAAPPSVAVAAHATPRFGVVIDAAHGGDDSGARLSDHALEKDLVLTLAVRLRSSLSAHGISVVTTRESDSAVSQLNRAEAANHVGASACITLHATTSGSGVHLFTSSLTQIPNVRFLPWDTAQGAYAEQSLRLSSELDSAMTHAEIPVTLGRTALQPLDSFTCPAVVVEFSPLNTSGRVTPLSDPAYQDRIVAAMLAAVEQWQHDWRQQP